MAAQLWLDELEAKLRSAAVTKWLILGEEFGEELEGEILDDYVARSDEVDRTQPIHDELARARLIIEERALAVADRDDWPAGGSALARAYALALEVGQQVDHASVQVELAELRRRSRLDK